MQSRASSSTWRRSSAGAEPAVRSRPPRSRPANLHARIARQEVPRSRGRTGRALVRKWAGITFGTLAALAIVLYAVVYFASERVLNRASAEVDGSARRRSDASAGCAGPLGHARPV